MANKNYTNSTADCVFNKETNRYLDMDIELIQEDIKDILRRLTNFKFFNLFKDINIVDGQETISDIAKNLPPYSMFYFHKTGGHVNDMYPHSAGLLVVQKGYSNSRVKFEFSRDDAFWIGFYDELNSVKWSGWKKVTTDLTSINIYALEDITTSTSDGIIEIIKAMPVRSEVIIPISASMSNKTILSQCPKDSGILTIYKERNSRTRIEFTESSNGYANPIIPVKCWANYDSTSDKLSKWGSSYYGFGSSSERPVSNNRIMGSYYFDTDLNKPIWFNGTNWVDATGTTV